MGNTGFYWVLRSLTEFYRVFHGCIGFYSYCTDFYRYFTEFDLIIRVLLGFPEFHWLIVNNTGFLLGFTEFSIVIPRLTAIILIFTEFHRVLPRYFGFDCV